MKHWQETKRILDRLAELTAAGQGAAIACVIRISGSAYRRPGARFLIADDGSTLGGISGGCLEEDVRQTGLGVIETGECRMLHYETGNDDEAIWGLGLGCDGTVDIFVVSAARLGYPKVLNQLRKMLDGNSPFAVITIIGNTSSANGAEFDNRIVVLKTGPDQPKCTSLERSTWAGVPYKFEAGTPSVADAVGLGASIDYLMELGMENVRTHEKQIVSYAMERLAELPFIRFFGPRDPADRCGLVSFIDADIHPHDLGTVVDQHGVAIRAGHHCAKPLMHRLGVVATARASFYIYNDRSDVNKLVDSLLEARKVFGL